MFFLQFFKIICFFQVQQVQQQQQPPQQPQQQQQQQQQQMKPQVMGGVPPGGVPGQGGKPAGQPGPGVLEAVKKVQEEAARQQQPIGKLKKNIFEKSHFRFHPKTNFPSNHTTRFLNTSAPFLPFYILILDQFISEEAARQQQPIGKGNPQVSNFDFLPFSKLQKMIFCGFQNCKK